MYLKKRSARQFFLTGPCAAQGSDPLTGTVSLFC